MQNIFLRISVFLYASHFYQIIHLISLWLFYTVTVLMFILFPPYGCAVSNSSESHEYPLGTITVCVFINITFQNPLCSISLSLINEKQ